VQIARTVALARHNTLGESARLFGALGLALADAGIAAWDAKYVCNFWRPVTPLNQPGDPAWAPLLVTPPFPGYVSGHSTFSGAAETVLTAFYPGPVSFTSTADDGSRAVRSFTSFRQAADEAGRSRIYGGIHFEFDNQAGLASGRALGSWVAAHYVS
jgi:membrane-associated phospholipid phosphatase